MKRTHKGSTIKQYAYAVRKYGGKGTSKKEIALLSGYTPAVADNVKAKIEDTEGYQNAVIVLAHESNNLLMGVLAEFKARGLTEFSNADLVKALNAITGAWDKIDTKRAPQKMKDQERNPLRGVFTRRVETQTAVITEVPASATVIHEQAPTVVTQEITTDEALDF